MAKLPTYDEMARDVANKVLDEIEYSGKTIRQWIDIIAEQPEIMRCKDCKHRDPEDKKCDCGHDIQWQLPRQDDWFCADAERREVTDGRD